MLSLLLDILSVQDSESITAIMYNRPKGEKSELNESAQKREGGKIYRELRKIHIEIQYSSPPPHI